MNDSLRLAVAIALPFFVGCADEMAPPPVYPAPPPPGPSTDVDPAPPVQQQQPDVQIGVDGDAYADTDPSALTDFKASLDPHGTWADDSTYGTVWVPNPEEVGPDFQPYVSSGHWVYEDDYAWASDYEWGWAPFHYGRWVRVEGRGWEWIPGRVYAGAWVDWRMGEGEYAYVGWGPRPPVWGWRGGYAVGFGFVPRGEYVYCGRAEIFEPRIGARIVVGERVGVIAEHTRPYVASAPSAAGHPYAYPVAHGPPPSALGIEPSRVVHPSASDRSVVHAQQFARPSAAQPMGAHAPTPHVIRSAPAVSRPAPPRAPPRPAPRRHH